MTSGLRPYVTRQLLSLAVGAVWPKAVHHPACPSPSLLPVGPVWPQAVYCPNCLCLCVFLSVCTSSLPCPTQPQRIAAAPFPEPAKFFVFSHGVNRISGCPQTGGRGINGISGISGRELVELVELVVAARAIRSMGAYQNII